MKKRFIIGSLVTLLLLGAATWLVSSKPIPSDLKLMDLNGATSLADFTCPNAEKLRLVIGVNPISGTPDMNRSCPTFAGRVEFLFEGVVTHRFDISSTQVTTCNWLDHGEPNLDGFILTLAGYDTLTFLDSDETYEVRVIIDDKPMEISSLWLCFLQNARQKQG